MRQSRTQASTPSREPARAEAPGRAGKRPRATTRRRGEELEATILEAAWDEVHEVGYARLTMENVAARARTGKQVLYRRWPNRAALLVAAARHRFGSIGDRIPDTGSLRGDLLAVLRGTARRQHEFGPDLIHGILADLPDLGPEFFTIMTDVMTAIFERAAERGEIRPVAELNPRILTLPTDLLRYELLLRPGLVADRTVVEIVDDIVLPLVRRSDPPAPA